jgi:hypothetical protein
MGEAPCTVADSVHDFSLTQNAAGWSYGYWLAQQDANGYQPDADFMPLTACPDMTWHVACVPQTDASFRWTFIQAELEHGATIPELQMPVRRWISDVSGKALAVLDHHHGDPGAGDGTRAILLLDGVSIWEHEVDASGTDGIQTSVPLELEQGSKLELMLDPRANESSDATYFSVVLQNR